MSSTEHGQTTHTQDTAGDGAFPASRRRRASSVHLTLPHAAMSADLDACLCDLGGVDRDKIVEPVPEVHLPRSAYTI
jgi:hypothetical protein